MTSSAQDMKSNQVTTICCGSIMTKQLSCLMGCLWGVRWSDKGDVIHVVGHLNLFRLLCMYVVGTYYIHFYLLCM